MSGTGAEPFLLTPEMRVDPDAIDPASIGNADTRDGIGPELASVDPAGERPPHGVQAPVDRELLRSMVSDLVREELRGETGERITDRIRQFVAREVQHALTGRQK